MGSSVTWQQRNGVAVFQPQSRYPSASLLLEAANFGPFEQRSPVFRHFMQGLGELIWRHVMAFTKLPRIFSMNFALLTAALSASVSRCRSSGEKPQSARWNFKEFTDHLGSGSHARRAHVEFAEIDVCISDPLGKRLEGRVVRDTTMGWPSSLAMRGAASRIVHRCGPGYAAR
jgi:hypothetical protein